MFNVGWIGISSAGQDGLEIEVNGIPDPEAVKGAAKAGADGVLINCDGFSNARTMDEASKELDMIPEYRFFFF